MSPKWQPPVRNWDGIQHAELRQKVDHRFNEFHDALSAHYYEERDLPEDQKTDFIWKGRNYGKLDKEKFDKLHGLCFELREIAFHNENLKQSAHKRIPLKKYNPADEGGKTRVQRALEFVERLKAEGLELEI